MLISYVCRLICVQDCVDKLDKANNSTIDADVLDVDERGVVTTPTNLRSAKSPDA